MEISARTTTYTGQRLDPESGLYHFHFRQYDADFDSGDYGDSEADHDDDGDGITNAEDGEADDNGIDDKDEEYDWDLNSYKENDTQNIVNRN